MSTSIPRESGPARLDAAQADVLAVQQQIASLVGQIRAEWESGGWNRDDLPRVAEARLRHFLSAHPMPVRAIAHWIFGTSSCEPDPLDDSHPATVVLHRDERMVIEVEFRFQDHGEIIESPHAGATAVLHGRVAIGQWSFDDPATLAPGVRRGLLRRSGAVVLREGEVRPFGAGQIEQSVGLTPICVLLTVRTHDDEPGWIHRVPGLAFRRRVPDERHRRRRGLLARMPAKAVPFAAETCAALTVRRGTLRDGIELLDAMRELGYDRALLQEVCERAYDVHGDAIALVGHSMELTARQRVLEATGIGQDPDHRLLLFVLLHMPNKAAMVELLERVSPERDGASDLQRWIMEARGAFGLDAGELAMILLEELTRGATEAELFARLRDEFAPEDVEALGDEIRGLCRRILEHPLFGGLFADHRWRPPSHQRTFTCPLGLNRPHRASSVAPSSISERADTERWVLNPRRHLQEEPRVPPPIAGSVPFAGELSTRPPILWVEQPHTHHWMPYWLPPDDHGLLADVRRGRLDLSSAPPTMIRSLRDAGILVAADGDDPHLRAWERTMQEARRTYRRDGYAVLPRLVDPLWRAALRSHYRALHDGGQFVAEREPPGGLAMYLEGATRFLQHQLARTVAEIVDEPVMPSFCYTRIYGERAELVRHIDRPSCVWNISMPFDLDPPTERDSSWPLFVKCSDHVAEIRLEMGDGALFRGVSAEHWRPPQPAGHRSIFGFAMFAPCTYEGTLY